MQFLFSVSWGAASGWWVILCLAVGAAYAWLMYRQPVIFENKLRYILTAIRFASITALGLLLLSPLIKSTTYQPQKPLILVTMDNSSSIKKFNPKTTDLNNVVADLDALKQSLGDKYDIRAFNFDKSQVSGKTPDFNGKQTNIAVALHQFNDQFANQNIGAIVLATDGLYNEGADPLYEAKNIKSPIYTVGLGDTTIRRDLLISNISYNKSALLGNDFEVEVSAEAYLGKGKNIQLTVSEDGKQVANRSISVSSDNFRKTIGLKLNADKKGLRKFTFSIVPLQNEASVQNNTETIYVDVIDARQKILLVYDGPNPDIGALKQSIETNRNYELKLVNTADISTINVSAYNLIILYQAGGPGNQQLQNLIDKSNLPLWVIAGPQSDPGMFNREQKLIKLIISRIDNQEVFADQQPGFSAFTLSDSTAKKIRQFPPLITPFGNYALGAGASVLFKQKIGSIATPYPLMAFGEEHGRRTAVLTGEGLWRWQLAEFETYGNHNALDELVQQTVQYLTANINRQRFRVYSAKTVFNEGEHVVLNAELYNEALALTNTPDVKLDLKNNAGKNYSYQFSRNGQSYQLDAGALPASDYTYNATSELGKQHFTVNGQISITATDLETKQSKANHQLLKVISKTTGGEFVEPDGISKLADIIRKNDNIKTIVNEDKHYAELIDLKWIFALVVLLLSTEWFLRKREGEV